MSLCGAVSKESELLAMCMLCEGGPATGVLSFVSLIHRSRKSCQFTDDADRPSVSMTFVVIAILYAAIRLLVRLFVSLSVCVGRCLSA